MDARSIFAILSLMIVIHGAILAATKRTLPPALRPSVDRWQIGTIALAFGYATLAFGTSLPKPVMITAVNGSFVLGLTLYYQSLKSFDGLALRVRDFLPALATVACSLWFSALHPNFAVRLGVLSLASVWLMLACVRTLTGTAPREPSLSRKVMTGIFVLAVAVTIARLPVWLVLSPSRDFAISADAGWDILVLPALLGALPVIGVTVFLLMCADRLKTNLEHAALTDHLTDLPNRRQLSKYGEEKFLKAKERGVSFALAILDIDMFKALNDSFGHDVGDRALIHVSRCLREGIRKFDFIARSGGEEFVVILGEPVPENAVAIVERLRRAVQRNCFRAGSVLIPITVSAGVAAYRPGDASFEDALRRADSALYRAKSLGRNRVELNRAPPGVASPTSGARVPPPTGRGPSARRMLERHASSRLSP